MRTVVRIQDCHVVPSIRAGRQLFSLHHEDGMAVRGRTGPVLNLLITMSLRRDASVAANPDVPSSIPGATRFSE
jgi:hypothetical protein